MFLLLFLLRSYFSKLSQALSNLIKIGFFPVKSIMIEAKGEDVPAEKTSIFYTDDIILLIQKYNYHPYW